MAGILGKRILVIAAHPDDEVLGCGGLIASNAAAGGKNTVLIVSEGSGAQNGHDKVQMERRHEQLEAATQILGVHQLVHWDYPDMRLDEISHLELNRLLHSFIAEGNFEIVLSHHPYDVNRDHQVLHSSVLVACRPTPSCVIQALLTYHVNSSTEWGLGPASMRFTPNVFVDISSHLQTKLRALAVYEDELRDYPHPRSLEAVKDRARVFGSEMGMAAAEPFQLVYSRYLSQ